MHPLVEHLKLRIVGLDCVSCSRVINRALESINGVKNVGVSYMMDLALVDYDSSIITKDEIIGIIKKTGYDVIPVAN